MDRLYAWDKPVVYPVVFSSADNYSDKAIAEVRLTL